MFNHSQSITTSHGLRWSAFWNPLALWFLISVTLVVFFVLSPAIFARPDPAGLRLGTDVPFLMLADTEGRLTAPEVAALLEAAFTHSDQPLNKGYTRDVYWLRVTPPARLGDDEGASWLEVLPTYLDRVTLYQQIDGAWQEHHSGDLLPMAERTRVRELVLPLVAGNPFLLRVQTTSPMQMDATLWRSTGLMSKLSSTQWASGFHQGINLMHALLIIGAALALRIRSLSALAVASVVCLVHGAADRGYLQLWLPAPLEYLGDLLVKVGTLILPAALFWQFREVLSLATRWRRVDRLLMTVSAASLLCLISIPLGLYSDWAWVGVGAPWAITAVVTVVTWLDLLRDGVSQERVVMVLPSSVYVLIGLYVTGAYLGWAPIPTIETSVLWQLNTLLVNSVVTFAVGTGLVRRFRDSLEKLARSEHTLEERVRQRTAELLQTQNTLQAALESERNMREEQRHFFDMVNHEFRTPLTIIDSAATEQATFPSPDFSSQIERATQILRACRRLTALAENCLVRERLDATGFGLRVGQTAVPALIEEAVQLVRWSSRHQLLLKTSNAPAIWQCDSTLVQIALSNLVDNAVKHGKAGKITVTARHDSLNRLEFSVSDEGPGLSPELIHTLFDRFERGARADQTRGFGLGLWVARRVARLHGGDVRIEATSSGGACFTLVLGRMALT